MARKFQVGDLVRHKQTKELVFVVEFELLSADGDEKPSLYRCSQPIHIGYERQTYHENDLVPAGEVGEIDRPSALKWSTIALHEMLEFAKYGGMREKRAGELHEEFVDHWNAVSDASDAMRELMGRIKVLAELAERATE